MHWIYELLRSSRSTRLLIAAILLSSLGCSDNGIDIELRFKKNVPAQIRLHFVVDPVNGQEFKKVNHDTMALDVANDEVIPIKSREPFGRWHRIVLIDPSGKTRQDRFAISQWKTKKAYREYERGNSIVSESVEEGTKIDITIDLQKPGEKASRESDGRD